MLVINPGLGRVSAKRRAMGKEKDATPGLGCSCQRTALQGEIQATSRLLTSRIMARSSILNLIATPRHRRDRLQPDKLLSLVKAVAPKGGAYVKGSQIPSNIWLMGPAFDSLTNRHRYRA
jgi:hypothetical protein